MRRRSFYPHVELLEGRVTPSASVHHVGHTLSVVGTNLNDHIWINDNGNHVDVYLEGHFKGRFAGINKVNLLTEGGNDSVKYNIRGNAVVSRDIVANLGNGNDSFTALVVARLSVPTTGTPAISNLAALSELHIAVAGGNGNDGAIFEGSIGVAADMSFHFNGGAGNDVYEGIILGVQPNASVDLVFAGGAGRNFGFAGAMNMMVGSSDNVTMVGGNDNDVFRTGFDGELDGSISSYLTGGAGRDQISTDVDPEAGNTGEAFALVRGDNGDDNLGAGLALDIDKSAAPGFKATGYLDGGPGTDAGSARAGTTVVSIESFTPIV